MTKLEKPTEIVSQVAAGFGFSMAVTNNGIYSVGENTVNCLSFDYLFFF